MKILFLMQHLFPPVGGAERSMATLLRKLKAKPGVEASYLCESNFSEKGIQAIWDNDVVVTQLSWAEEAIRGAKTCGKKSVFFVRSFENLCKVSEKSEVISHCNQKCRLCPFRSPLSQPPDLIIANSHFTQRFLKDEHGLESEVIYPFIDFDEIKAPEKERKYITMNQFAYHKGADLFLRIAAALPKLSFRVAGYQCWRPTVAVPNNVTFTGTVDPRDIYSDTLLFLAPARWNETFGRTLIEAQYNGIPVIASARGAAREDGLVPPPLLIEDIDNIDSWTRRIQIALENYEHFANAARSMDFKPFELDSSVDRFLSLLSELSASRDIS